MRQGDNRPLAEMRADFYAANAVALATDQRLGIRFLCPKCGRRLRLVEEAPRLVFECHPRRCRPTFRRELTVEKFAAKVARARAAGLTEVVLD